MYTPFSDQILDLRLCLSACEMPGRARRGVGGAAEALFSTILDACLQTSVFCECGTRARPGPKLQYPVPELALEVPLLSPHTLQSVCLCVCRRGCMPSASRSYTHPVSEDPAAPGDSRTRTPQRDSGLQPGGPLSVQA